MSYTSASCSVYLYHLPCAFASVPRVCLIRVRGAPFITLLLRRAVGVEVVELAAGKPFAAPLAV